MNKIKTLIITTLTALVLTGCGAEGGKGDTSGGNSSDSQDSYGTFPYQVFDEFTKATGLSIPRITTTTEWEADISYDTDGGYYYAYGYTDDNDNTLENTYKAALEEASWVNTNDDTYTYDLYGYFYDDSTGELEVQFYHDTDEEGDYFFLACYLMNKEYDPGTGGDTGDDDGDDDVEGYDTYTGFPQTLCDSFGAVKDVAFPHLESSQTWYGAITEDLYGDDVLVVFTDDDDDKIGVNSLEDQYLAAVTAANWICCNSASTPYDKYGYVYCDPSYQVLIMFYTYEDEFDLYGYIRDMTPTPVSTFSADVINEFLKDTGVTIPTMTVEADWEYGVDEDEDGEYAYATCSDEGTCGEDAIEDTYKAIVEEASWTCSNDTSRTYDDYGYLYVDSTNTAELMFYTYNGVFMLYAYLVPEEEVADTTKFNFSNTAQITSQSADSVTWQCGNYTMNVTKGTATVNVGNGSYLGDPELRLYKGNVVTITWEGEAPKAFVFNVNVSGSSGKSALENGCTATGASVKGATATMDAEASTITYTLSEGATSLVVTIGGGKQLWLTSIEFVL